MRQSAAGELAPGLRPAALGRFDLIRLRLQFQARERIHFPEGKAGDLLRGALGMALARVAGGDAYTRIFRPRAQGAGPSGLADPPRPFVIRARNLDGATAQPGEVFHFHVNVFTTDPGALESIERAFAEAAREGIGPGRGRAEMGGTTVEAISLDLSPAALAPPRVRVDFLSPIELKHAGRVVEKPDFPVLLARCRDRVGTLRELYGAGPLAIDFAAMGVRAAEVRMPRCELRRVERERRSSRTGQSHSIGGFTGFAEYEGELAGFLPFLEAACWTGIGRQAVWGKGEIAVHAAASPGVPQPPLG